MCYFSLPAFKSFSLSLVFKCVIIMYLGMNFGDFISSGMSPKYVVWSFITSLTSLSFHFFKWTFSPLSRCICPDYILICFHFLNCTNFNFTDYFIFSSIYWSIFLSLYFLELKFLFRSLYLLFLPEFSMSLLRLSIISIIIIYYYIYFYFSIIFYYYFGIS